MKNWRMLFSIAGIIIVCFQISCSRINDTRIEKRNRKQITAIAEEYIRSQLSNPEKIVSKDGIITIGDKQKRYVMEQSKIFTGLIDDDQKEDAIISLSVFQGEYQTISEQLIILNSENKFVLVRTMESDMRIISLKDRIITADVPEHSRNTPLFNCPSCWEVKKFRYKMVDLMQVE